MSETRKSEPTQAHCGKFFVDFPRTPSDLWPTSPSWTCHEGLPLSFWGGGGHFPDTQVGETMKKEKKKKRQKKKNVKKNQVENDESSQPRL